MSNQFYLIQRGKIQGNPETAKGFFDGSKSKLVYLDYMGSAEFEFGAIPAAYSRIMSQFEDYELSILDFTTVRGVPVCLFCRKDRRDDIVSAIKEYISNPYQLKECSNLPQHFKKPRERDRYALGTNFWWCIDHSWSPDVASVGDWILFIGAADRQQAFLRVINSDFTERWTTMSEEMREMRVNKAWRH